MAEYFEGFFHCKYMIYKVNFAKNLIDIKQR
ncbi:hypothetical protein F945_03230 [Acinetobacter rudis CIP 110305]|uniref:Uncharacterized protein n=1 Tax=Acinetobacter rudis CIP 110305 TaxID=421052 RepID=S3MUJ1_9GAMM|nr:hypothetical protein F945_03230 [Acinetobacter rudis CIP 110305]